MRPGPPPRPAFDELFAESWGPVSRLAAAAGLSPQGPLMLPGRWLIQ